MAEFIKEIPKVGSRFRNPEEAWKYWVKYGGRMGFDVRKRYTNKSSFDQKVTSCRYVCSNEGHRRKGASDHVTKCFRAETRTDCKARMTLTLDRGKDNYEVTDVFLEHNHLLHLPETRHLMASQRKISDLQAFEIETADDSGIRPKAAHELASRQVGGQLNLSYTCRDRKNYLQLPHLMNVKILPTHYVLKRWTREARNRSIQDRHGRKMVENPRLEAQLNYKFLSHKFLNLAYKAASSPECCLLIDSALDCLGTQLEDKLNVSSSAMNETCLLLTNCIEQENVDPNVQQRDDLLSAAKLKKKDVQAKNSSRRKKTWIDKLHKAKRKSTKSSVSTKKTTKQQKEKGGTNPQVEVEHDGNNKEDELQEYAVIGNFTQLITAPTLANEDLPDLF